MVNVVITDLNFLKSKRGQGGGIGTLIIFIAIVLVASIAAYVLLGTAGSLQSRSLLVGKEATTRVATQLEAESIYGKTNYTGGMDNEEHGIEALITVVKITPGSDPVDMENVHLHFATDDLYISKIDLNSSLTQDVANNASDYYFRELNGNGDNLLESGESFEIHYFIENEDGQYTLPKKTEISLTLRAEAGTEVIVQAVVPYIDHDFFVKIYP